MSIDELNEELLTAACCGDLEHVGWYLSLGAEINCRNEDMKTPLHMAVQSGNATTVNVILHRLERQDVNPNAKDKDGNTPLHIAAERGDVYIVRSLLARGDIHISENNKFNRTPYDVVKWNKSWGEPKIREKEIKQLLQQHGEKASDKLIAELRYQIGLAETGDLQEILQLGQYKCFWNRVYVVGPYFSGKSCLTKILVGESLPIERESTDGIWIYIGRAGMDLDEKKWIFIPKGDAVAEILGRMLMTLSISESLATDNQTMCLNESTNEISTPESNTAYDGASGTSSSIDLPSDDTVLETNTLNVNVPKGLKHRVSFVQPQAREKYKEKLIKEVATELSHDKIHELVISSILDGKYKQNIIPIDIWDFGGQKDYYMTHQLFITSRGIFVLAFNGCYDLHKHLPDLAFLPGHVGKSSIAVYLLHWVNSILTYCKRSKDGFPKIIFVATHKDKIRKNVDKHRNLLMTALQDLFQSHAGLKHLDFKPLIFVNATDNDDPEINTLRQRLMNGAMEHPRWGEPMPTAWVPLELQLAQQAEKGANILPKTEIKLLNLKNETMVLTDKQLELFLNIQHSLGKLLYFDTANLRDFVILTPAYLVEVLRSLVTEKQFWPKGERYQNIFQTMQKTGVVSRDDIYFVWNQDCFKHILPNKVFMVDILAHLDILVAEKRSTDDFGSSLHGVSRFLVPSMLSSPNDTQYLNKFRKSETSILLAYRFIEEVIPPALPYRFLASFIAMWGVKNYKNKKQMLFNNLAVVEVDAFHDVAVEVIENRVVVSLIHSQKKENIVPTLASAVQECLTAAIHRISEFYSTLSEEFYATAHNAESKMVMPFEIEFGVLCNKTLCFFHHERLPKAGQNPVWLCKTHNKKHDVSWLKCWFSEKMARKQCASSCKGLGRLEEEQSPSDKHLRRLASSLEIEDCRQLLVILGLDVKDWNEVEAQFNSPAFHGNEFKFAALLKWKQGVTNSSFKTIQDAFAMNDLDKHLLCEVFREVDIEDVLQKFSISEDIAIKKPSNDVLKTLSNQYIGNSGMQLGIELGLDSSEVQRIQYEHRGKLIQQNEEILRVWSHTTLPKPSVRELIKALQSVGKINCVSEISF